MSWNMDAILRMSEENDRASPAAAQNDTGNQIVEILANNLVPFPQELHKFKPATPQRMAELVESIRNNGIINALIVRRLPDGRCQILTGHNRRTAAIQLGYRTVPCIIRNVPNDDDAIQIVVADNLNNRELLPSERGWAYRLLLEARDRQGEQLENFSSQNGTRLGNATCSQNENKLKTASIIGKEFGDSRNKVYRHIRLTWLIKPLLELVDAGKIGLGTGEQLSYLTVEAQQLIYAFCYLQEPNHPLKEAQARTLREIQEDPNRVIDEDTLEELTTKPQKTRLRTLKLEMSKLRDYFPPGTPEEVVVQTIHSALASYFEQKES